MTEGDQDQRSVTMAVAANLGGLDQLLDFRRCQIFPGPKLEIGGPNWN
jgi:hypothetical protein